MTDALLAPLAALLGHRLGDTSRRLLTEGLQAAAAAVGGGLSEAVALVCARHPVAWRAWLGRAVVAETSFFRHPEHFALLRQRAAEAWAQGHPYRTAWSVGCSSGEEAYSLALTLLPLNEVRVLASDVSPAALAATRAGRYRAHAFREVSPGTLPELREVEPGVWEVSERVRACVVPQELNLATDALWPPPPLPPRVDVVFCRNVLFYLTPEVARRVLEGLAAAVAEGGLLVLGAVEAPVEPPPGFVRVGEAGGSAFLRVTGGERWARPPRVDRGVPVLRVEQPRVGLAPPVGGGRPLEVVAAARRLADAGQLEAALQALRTAGEVPEALYLAALIHLERRELAGASHRLERLLALRPDYVPAHLQLALLAGRLADGAALARHRGAVEALLAGRPAEAEVEGAGIPVGTVREVLAGLTAREGPP